MSIVRLKFRDKIKLFVDQRNMTCQGSSLSRDFSRSLMTTTTTIVYFNEVVFPSVLGLTSPMAFPQHFPPPWPVPSILLTKSLLSYLLLPFTPSPSTCSVPILFNQHNSSLLSTWPNHLSLFRRITSPMSSIAFSFHLNSLLSSTSTSSFHSSEFSLYPLSLLAMSHCHTTLQVLCMLYR